jgi:hypothetical protein
LLGEFDSWFDIQNQIKIKEIIVQAEYFKEIRATKIPLEEFIIEGWI